MLRQSLLAFGDQSAVKPAAPDPEAAQTAFILEGTSSDGALDLASPTAATSSARSATKPLENLPPNSSLTPPGQPWASFAPQAPTPGAFDSASTDAVPALRSPTALIVAGVLALMLLFASAGFVFALYAFDSPEQQAVHHSATGPPVGDSTDTASMQNVAGPLGRRTTTSSPSRLPMSALAMGESMLMRSRPISVSSGPTIR